MKQAFSPTDQGNLFKFYIFCAIFSPHASITLYAQKIDLKSRWGIIKKIANGKETDIHAHQMMLYKTCIGNV